MTFNANLPPSPTPSNVVPQNGVTVKPGAAPSSVNGVAPGPTAHVVSTPSPPDGFDPLIPLTWPKGMWPLLKSNIPSTEDAVDAYLALRGLQTEDERDVLLRSIDDAPAHR